MLGFVQRLFDTNDREVKKLQAEVVDATDALETKMEQVQGLRAAYAELRQRHQQGGESLEALMPEAFAMARESAKR